MLRFGIGFTLFTPPQTPLPKCAIFHFHGLEHVRSLRVLRYRFHGFILIACRFSPAFQKIQDGGPGHLATIPVPDRFRESVLPSSSLATRIYHHPQSYNQPKLARHRELMEAGPATSPTSPEKTATWRVRGGSCLSRLPVSKPAQPVICLRLLFVVGPVETWRCR